MGMAASQARYLALTARKTNTEYEGQQINQARTALANQSANLFNRLLGLEVPTAPKTTDYTELQYSYSDGTNDSVIDNWQQLSTADPDYNYIVNHYYYTNVYTGGQKLLSNPEVQTKGEVVKENLTPKVTGVSIDPVNNTAVVTLEDGTTRTYSAVSGLQKTKDLENALQDFDTAQDKAISSGLLSEDAVYGWQDTNGIWHFMVEEDLDKGEYNDYSTIYKPGYVGNCELTELTQPLDKDVEAELKQIVKDLPDTEFAKYFDDNNNYAGYGIYSFQMNGQTYFASEYDLYNSMQTYDEYGKPIESQEKLPYYNASYIKTRIEETNKALLETDGNGRFTSVKFDDDSVVYSLNVETVTDEKAYEDAMNEYRYKVQQYEKTIADINAKTSIIQQEDRTLELRLKQLDTEQNALSTEMEAVKKVIKDNVESTFKTFSD
ncbi:MAG: hypothetical protein NC408_02970 [Candidatus Gastranaerophilales bacterium]|nr:hypothetical protein [Candidatus Gastranaerophilales bacterium]MCM1072717.1 hypothetical protein [Bacteroides sp.]